MAGNDGRLAGHGPIAYEYGTYSIDLGPNGRDRGKYVRVLRNTAGMTYINDKTTGALMGQVSFGGGRA